MSDPTPSAWFLSNGQGSQTGPHSTAEVVGAIHLRQIGPGYHAHPVDGGHWQPIEAIPVFASVLAGLPPVSAPGVAAPVAPQAPGLGSQILARALAASIGPICGIALVAWLCSGNKTERSASTHTPPTTATTPAPAATPKSDPQAEAFASFIAKLVEAKTLTGGIALTRPLMKDKVNEPDDGADMLSVWGTTHGLDWKELQAIPETSIAKMKKDPDLERGKRLCIAGTVIEIQRVEKVYGGRIMNDAIEVVTFLALGDTGNIVGNSTGRLCGIATGLLSYSNAAGGTTHSVRVVGAFDLPSNKPKAIARP